jgi:nucleoside-diphosphate-sugar epimerase
MKVFVTGHKGYIGVHLVNLLREQGHQVTGCDLNLFEGCEWENYQKPDKELLLDIRELKVEDLKGYDCFMHLAAISNDPMGELNPEITRGINLDATVELAKMAKKAGIPRFLFASSCSIYGKGESLDLDETANVNPQSAYAYSKIESEKALSKLADEHFSPVYLRNATAYGHSPMLRLDLVVNNLLGCAYSRGDIRIMSDGSPWRPLIHAKDIARAFIAFMHAPKDRIHNQAVNVGSNKENYQVKEIADYVKKFIPKATIVFTGEVGVDPRDYRVNFDKLSRLLPDFKLAYTLEKGMQELHSKFVEYKFKLEDFDGDRFVRLRTLKKRLGKLGNR